MKRAIVGRVRVFALAGVVGVGLLGAGGAPPAEARPVQGPTVDVGTTGGLAPDGRSIAVGILARCPERWAVTEALVRISQPQATGEASFPLTCTGGFQSFSVSVQSAGAPFELGEAQATASVIVKRGRTEQAQDSQVITVEPTVFVAVGDIAKLQGEGETVSIDVTVACPLGANGLQSYVNVSQGQATSGNGFYVPICDGRLHTFTVSVDASRGLFQPGSAQALTFAFVEAGGQSFSGVDDNPQLQIVT